MSPQAESSLSLCPVGGVAILRGPTNPLFFCQLKRIKREPTKIFKILSKRKEEILKKKNGLVFPFQFLVYVHIYLASKFFTSIFILAEIYPQSPICGAVPQYFNTKATVTIPIIRHETPIFLILNCNFCNKFRKRESIYDKFILKKRK